MESEQDIYKETPVSPVTFLLSSRYLNRSGFIFPSVLEAYQDINSGAYNKAVLTGTGKSTAFTASMLYQVYLLSMMRDCYSTFGLSRSSRIVSVVQSVSNEVAKDQCKRVRALVEGSPYFTEVFKFYQNIRKL